MRKGEMERERAFADLEVLVSLSGVPRELLLRDAVLEPASLGVMSVKRLRTISMSASVLDIRSRKFFHRCADSACLRKVSPFLVTRSRTPLSIIERTFDVAGI